MNDILDRLAKSLFGISRSDAIKQGICVSCKEKPVFADKTEVDEYKISALCDKCFNRITDES
jgi:hypothetical protein